MSAFVAVVVAGQGSNLPSYGATGFFPVCSPTLLEGTHPLQGPEDLKHHTLIHNHSMAFESAFPTWRTWLQAAGFLDINCERGLQINDSAAAYQAASPGGVLCQSC
jgi:LysR family transcriptional regulator, glycine cleavage system transcriptional activator